VKKPTIGAVLISKNEETLIGDCLKSLRELDEIVLLDTGSSDGTLRIAEELGFPNLHTHSEKFEDPFHFANARNAAAEFATSDWLLSVDCDERLADGSERTLRASIATADRLKANAGTVRFRNTEEREYNRRIVWKRKLWEWRFRIHEELIPLEEKKALVHVIKDAFIFHVPKSPEKIEERRKQNLELLLEEVQVDPSHIAAHWNLGMEFYGMGNYRGCIRELRRWLSSAQCTDMDSSQAHLTIGWAFRDMGMQSEAVAAFQAANRCCPARREPLIAIGAHLAKTGRLREAEKEFAAACAIKSAPDYAFNDRAAYSNAPEVALATIRDEISRLGS